MFKFPFSTSVWCEDLNLTLPNYKESFLKFCVLANHCISYYLTERKMLDHGWFLRYENIQGFKLPEGINYTRKPVYGFEGKELYCIWFKVTSLLVSRTCSHMFWVFPLFLEYMTISYREFLLKWLSGDCSHRMLRVFSIFSAI